MKHDPTIKLRNGHHGRRVWTSCQEFLLFKAVVLQMSEQFELEELTLFHHEVP